MNTAARILCLFAGMAFLALAIVPNFTAESASYKCTFGFRLLFAAVGGLLIELATKNDHH